MQYFSDVPTAKLLIEGWNDRAVTKLNVVECRRCFAIVHDDPTAREGHESFHRGWWVEYQEADRQQMLKDYEKVYPGLAKDET